MGKLLARCDASTCLSTAKSDLSTNKRRLAGALVRLIPEMRVYKIAEVGAAPGDACRQEG
jgi:hypothetical protein